MAKPLVDSPDEILELIPQRPPMVMVDSLLSVSADAGSSLSVSSLTVRPDNVFVSDGRFLEAGVIEHVAQSAALRVGYMLRSQNRAIPAGFICSVSRVSFHGIPRVGSCLYTTVSVLQEVGPLSSIGFSVSDSGSPVAEGQMKIILDV